MKYKRWKWKIIFIICVLKKDIYDMCIDNKKNNIKFDDEIEFFKKHYHKIYLYGRILLWFMGGIKIDVDFIGECVYGK